MYFQSDDDADNYIEEYSTSHRKAGSPKKASPHNVSRGRNVDNSFPVHIQVDRALHLPCIVDQSRYQRLRSA